MVLSDELLAGHPQRSAAIVAGLLALAVIWHLSLPSFFYVNSAVFIEGPLPAIVGVAVALFWLVRDEPGYMQAFGAGSGAWVAGKSAIVVLGSLAFGPVQAVSALWADSTAGFGIPLAALGQLWGTPRFTYGLWAVLRSIFFYWAVGYVVCSWQRYGWRSVIPTRLPGGLGDRWAFDTAQRRQLKAYRECYLAAVRGGEAPPPVPAGMLPQGGGMHGLAGAHLALKIGLTLAGALGLAGSGWALFGNALGGPVGAIFLRGLGR